MCDGWSVHSISYNMHTQHVFACGLETGQVCVYDLRKGQKSSTLPRSVYRPHRETVWGLEYCPNETTLNDDIDTSSLLLTSSDDKYSCLLDTAEFNWKEANGGILWRSGNTHTDFVRDVTWERSGAAFYTIAWDNKCVEHTLS